MSKTGSLAGQADPENRYALAAVRATGAVILARLGRAEAALQMLATVPGALDRASAWAPNYTLTACNAAATLWCVERLDHADCVERNLRDKVVASDFRFPMVDSRLALAQLCALQRRYDEAVEWFAKARAVLDEQGARPLRAIVDYDEALMCVRRGEPGDPQRAAPLLEAALRQFRDIGMPGWIRCAEHLLRDGKEWRLPAQPTDQPLPHPIGKEGGQRPATRNQAPETGEHASVFQREGEYWTLAYRGRTARLRDTKGLSYIARLLAEPGRELHVRDLATILGPGDPGSGLGVVARGGRPRSDSRCARHGAIQSSGWRTPARNSKRQPRRAT